ncbi:hypothetical protein [Asticcacaulis solisilvae]|uniref:hypothetical protein n=1 Tax=Asticcacaulis solisilvae TaxID=1217274 RepID=UPI003FD73374
MATPAQFKPYTDNFGSLTLHATILGDGAVMTPEDHRKHINMLVVIAAILSLIVAVVAAYGLDKMVFAGHDRTGQPALAYNGMAVDTD